MSAAPRMGVVIVAFQSAAIIDECLESLFAARGADLRVVVVDNASADATCDVIADWASGRVPYRRRADSPLSPAQVVVKPINWIDASTDAAPAMPCHLTLLRSPFNGGYAHGVNAGLRLLLADPLIEYIWVLNPDCVVSPETPAAIMDATTGERFSLLGGRTLFYERPDEIQTDGGRVSRRTGTCKSVNAGQSSATTLMPCATTLDYITGASLVATRKFVEAAGPMEEDYFLYYEEVDWAFRRGTLPLRVSADMIVYHRGGTTIGTGDTTRRPSAFANYFNFRNRLRFVRRFLPGSLLAAIGYGLAKGAQLLCKGAVGEAEAVIAGTLALPPPARVSERISDATARAYAFGDRG